MVGSDIDGYTARFNELARLVPHMVTQENQRVNHYIRGLALEIKANVTSSRPTTIQSAVSMVNRLTTDGIKDGLFKKKENAGNKKRSNDQFKNQGRNDRNKRQRTGRNFTITAPDQGQGQRQYAGQHSKAINKRSRPTCYECGDPNHFRRNCPRMNQATTLGGNRPNPMLAIKENPNQGNNRNQACGRAFALGVAKAPQDPNIVTGILVGKLPDVSQRNITNPLVVVADSSATEYDSADEFSVCIIPLPPLEKLNGAEPISGSNTIKLILSYDHDTNGHNRIISLERKINPRNPQPAFKRCEVCGSLTHTTTDHYDIEWFKRGEALQAKKAEALK
ncbi:putative reverse transcriptase domain-containing protein [Tanacetum coccineum]|uniref:Reverse transcriptase domain-containing protein n=1 Tax=Tanacetum coccineum TaxID=301880 RepID=A0ABQ5DFI8_9ASTR